VKRWSLTSSALLAFTLVVAIHAHAQNTWVRVHGGSWEPDSKVLTDLKAGLERYVKAAARGQRRELRNWAEYVFQYQGQEEKGQKYILVNGICRREPGWNLEKQLVFVFDGGPCFLNLRFDPKRKQYYDLAINGYA
jgi:hypothetical protein